ncbi:hypothetical protein EV368DRAFT_63046 [Lentinula lateritia]|nr:hypothetical protein EV368DRAFT_63046 [Lentinula lateritia]
MPFSRSREPVKPAHNCTRKFLNISLYFVLALLGVLAAKVRQGQTRIEKVTSHASPEHLDPYRADGLAIYDSSSARFAERQDVIAIDQNYKMGEGFNVFSPPPLPLFIFPPARAAISGFWVQDAPQIEVLYPVQKNET